MLPRKIEVGVCLGLRSVAISVRPGFGGLWVGDLDFRGRKLEEVRVWGVIGVSVLAL